MTAIVRGVYKQGRIELLEIPPGLPEGHVRVVVTEDEQPRPPHCPLPFGKYQSDTPSTLEDFKDAEWHGEKEFDDPHGD